MIYCHGIYIIPFDTSSCVGHSLSSLSLTEIIQLDLTIERSA